MQSAKLFVQADRQHGGPTLVVGRMTMQFSAKLLFQYRVDLGLQSSKRRTCEERTIVFSATSARMAVATSKQRGKEAEFSYENDEGTPVHIEFIGVLDILQHGPEMENGTVWYEIKDRLLPKERHASFILTDPELLRRASR
jgi:hypothetical protein